jgi:hypothetical protein
LSDPIVRYEIIFHGSIFCRDVRPNAILDIPPELREVDIEGVLEEWEPTHGGDCDGPEPVGLNPTDFSFNVMRIIGGPPHPDGDRAICPPGRHNFPGEPLADTLCLNCGRRADDPEVGRQR